MKFTKIIIITLTTFVLFFIEAFSHFNIGKNGHNIKYQFEFFLPTKIELAYMVGIVLIFSIINGFISYLIIDMLK